MENKEKVKQLIDLRVQAKLGGGQGLKEMLQKNFAGFATNSAMIWTQNTTKAYLEKSSWIMKR